MEKQVVPTEQKIAWIEALLGSWVDILQLGSFVHPEKVPQMADTDRLFAHFSGPRPQARERRPLRPRPQREGPRARPGLRRRHVLHGRLRQRDPQPEEHRHGHRGGEPADHRHREERPRRGQARAGVGAVGLRLRLRGAGAEGARRRDREDVPRRGPAQPEPRRHRRPRDAGPGRGPLRAASAPSTRASSGPATSTTPTASPSPTATPRTAPASGTSSRRWPGSAAAPSRKVAGGNTCTEDLVHALQRSGLRTDIQLSALVDVARDMARVLRPRHAGLRLQDRPHPRARGRVLVER